MAHHQNNIKIPFKTILPKRGCCIKFGDVTQPKGFSFLSLLFAILATLGTHQLVCGLSLRGQGTVFWGFECS